MIRRYRNKISGFDYYIIIWNEGRKMYSEEMYGYGAQSSVIREIFSYGLARKAQIGEENVFDFSLGNPSVDPPTDVTVAFKSLLESCSPLELHGYTPAPGDVAVRKAIADNMNSRYGTALKPENFYMTCGAAAALKIILSALYEEGDEALTLTPFFPEYSVFAESSGYVFKPIQTDPDTFQPLLDKLEAGITEKTKLLILNSPNNPSGVVYTKENMEAVSELLRKKEEEYGHPIFIISDEPYRELVYGKELPYLPALYKDTIICYSYSKSLSLPGDRIGYICIPDEVTSSKELYAAVSGAGRALGYVCAPSFLQKVIEKCVSCKTDIKTYRENRDLLYGALTDYGYKCVYPDGAFYLCVKALEEDAEAFAERAKKYELLLVPGDSFCAPGYVRVSYCVSGEMIKRSLPAFKKLIEEYKENKDV